MTSYLIRSETVEKPVSFSRICVSHFGTKNFLFCGAHQGFLKHSWMQRIRETRPSCVILCFDWRNVYSAEVICCNCCTSKGVDDHSLSHDSTPQNRNTAIIKGNAVPSHIDRCCRIDGCSSESCDNRPNDSFQGGFKDDQDSGYAHDNGSPRTSRNAETSNFDSVTAAEHDAMSFIEFFRERMQRRVVAPRMVGNRSIMVHFYRWSPHA